MNPSTTTNNVVPTTNDISRTSIDKNRRMLLRATSTGISESNGALPTPTASTALTVVSHGRSHQKRSGSDIPSVGSAERALGLPMFAN